MSPLAPTQSYAYLCGAQAALSSGVQTEYRYAHYHIEVVLKCKFLAGLVSVSAAHNSGQCLK